MDTQGEFTFWFDGFTPKTIPMARLADYMSDLAVLLGESGSVHFARLEEGSTALVSQVDPEALPKVRKRVAEASTADGPPDAIKAIANINKRLREDGAVGRLLEGRTAEIIKFHGRESVVEQEFGPVTQSGSLVGQVIRVGGTTENVVVHIQSAAGTLYKCKTSKSVAKNIAKYLFTGDVRVSGLGRWLRTASGVWQQVSFQIHEFEPLDDQPLTSVVADLRAIRGDEWGEVDDPWGLLDQLRNDPDEAH